MNMAASNQKQMDFSYEERDSEINVFKCFLKLLSFTVKMAIRIFLQTVWMPMQGVYNSWKSWKSTGI